MKSQCIVQTPGQYSVVVEAPDPAPGDLIVYKDRVRIFRGTPDYPRNVLILPLKQFDSIEAEIDGGDTAPAIHLEAH